LDYRFGNSIFFRIFAKKRLIMRVKELMDIFNSYENVEIRDLLINGFKTSSPNEKRKVLRMFDSFKNKLENNLNFKAKAIAAYVRYNIEDFHHEHLTDAQMKELNPLIRNAIYTFLKDEARGNIFKISSTCALNLPSYWEDCEYVR